MDDATKQAVLSAIRSLLITLGGFLVARGYIADAALNEIVGAIMVILPAIWGIVDKFRAEKATKAREAVAVNAGIVAGQTGAAAGPVSLDSSQIIIKRLAPTTAMEGNTP